jgi:nucleoside phosphorylase
MAQPARPTSRSDFEIAIICALTLEADAVVALFDRYWDDEEERGDAPPYDKALGDANAYTAGRIGRHNVVVAHLPRDGKVRAANAASYCRMSWPAIKLALVVGICGAVPFTADGKEIILGDVIISEAVVQYDLGRQHDDDFVRKTDLLDSLPRPSEEILGFLAKLKTFRDKTRLEAKMEAHMAQLKENPGLEAEYPGVKQDTLFATNHDHPDGKTSEDTSCKVELIERRRLANAEPKSVIHFGSIASGDTVMKSGKRRDSIAKKEEGVIAFEMESAGVWGVFPCVVIKGVCDYADSHKLKNWQCYAAATAASCTKAFLEHWVPSAQATSCTYSQRQEQLVMEAWENTMSR